MLPVLAAISILSTAPAFSQSAMLEGSAAFDDQRNGLASPLSINQPLNQRPTDFGSQPQYSRVGTSVALPKQNMPVSPSARSPYLDTMPNAAPARVNAYSGRNVQEAQIKPFTQERPQVRAKLPNSNYQNGTVANSNQSNNGTKTDNRTFWQRHPIAKGAAIGGGVGAGAGALTGLITGQGIIRGAVIGAGTGAGVGVIRTSQIMKRHPIARDVATGAVSGLGLGWAGSRYPRAIAATTGIGAAIGLGTGLFTQLH